MKKGKIILGAVAAVVTAASALAFKVANKFTNTTPLYYQQLNKALDPIACLQCTREFKHKAGSPTLTITQCHLKGGLSTAATTLYTSRTVHRVVCQNPVKKFQSSD